MPHAPISVGFCFWKAALGFRKLHVSLSLASLSHCHTHRNCIRSFVPSFRLNRKLQFANTESDGVPPADQHGGAAPSFSFGGQDATVSLGVPTSAAVHRGGAPNETKFNFSFPRDSTGSLGVPAAAAVHGGGAPNLTNETSSSTPSSGTHTTSLFGTRAGPFAATGHTTNKFTFAHGGSQNAAAASFNNGMELDDDSFDDDL